MHQNMNKEKSPNACYQNEIKRFQTWVDNYPHPDELTLPPPSPDGKKHYVNTGTFDLYFTSSVSKREAKKSSCKKAIYAASALSKVEGSDLLITDLMSKAVFQILEVMDHKNETRDISNAKDPHKSNPMNIISQEDISLVLSTILSRATQWENIACTYSSCSTTLIRHNNTGKVTLLKLALIEGIPPNGIKTPHDGRSWQSVKEDDTDGRMLGFLVPPEDQVKKNGSYGDKKTEMVGGFRHKRYERCYIAIIGFSLLFKCHDPFRKLTFLKTAMEEDEGANNTDDEDANEDEDDDARDDNTTAKFWRGQRIFEGGYQSNYKACNRALEEAGVPKWEKATHLR